jgi:hypothetical protein
MERQPSEKRVAPRRRSLKGGRIIVHSLGSTFDCVIRNVSETGASLQLESQVGIPETFDLMFTEDKTLRKCRIVWRSANTIGVAFE